MRHSTRRCWGEIKQCKDIGKKGLKPTRKNIIGFIPQTGILVDVLINLLFLVGRNELRPTKNPVMMRIGGISGTQNDLFPMQESEFARLWLDWNRGFPSFDGEFLGVHVTKLC